MKTELIKATFTNLLFVIGVVLIIIGFVRGTDTLVKTIVFDTYPLDTWEESRCENEVMYQTTPAMVEAPVGTTSDDSMKQTQEKTEERMERCEASLNRQRDTKQVSDIVGSFTMLLSGVVLVYAFKGFIFNSSK